MVQLPAKVKNIIDRYLQALTRNNIPIKEAMLFGSYAKGDLRDSSDIDFEYGKGVGPSRKNAYVYKFKR